MFQERRGGKKWPYAFLLHEVFFPVKNCVANCILAADLREKQSRNRIIVLSCRACTIQCMCCWLQWLPKVMNPLLRVLWKSCESILSNFVLFWTPADKFAHLKLGYKCCAYPSSAKSETTLVSLPTATSWLSSLFIIFSQWLWFFLKYSNVKQS